MNEILLLPKVGALPMLTELRAQEVQTYKVGAGAGLKPQQGHETRGPGELTPTAIWPTT